MWFHKANKHRKDYYPDSVSGEPLKAFGPRGYWRWSKVYHEYYHRRKDGSYKWLNAANARVMAEALEYANLSKQANSGGTAKGFRISFSKAPGSQALLTRRITPGSSSSIPSPTSPKTSEYEVIFSPKLRSSSNPGVKIDYIDEPHSQRDGYYMSSKLWSGGSNTKLARGPSINRVSLSKSSSLAPSVGTNVREVSLSKGKKYSLLQAELLLKYHTVATDTRKISHIRIVVHDASSRAKSLKTTRNHWSIYLILLNQAGTVRVNMTMSESNTEILEWTLLSYPLSLSKIQDWDFKVVSNITVGKFYKLIHDNGRHRYVMGRQIDGDRFWMSVDFLLSDFEIYMGSVLMTLDILLFRTWRRRTGWSMNKQRKRFGRIYIIFIRLMAPRGGCIWWQDCFIELGRV